MQNWGAIFDWDGVIVDSGPYHEQSWHLLSAEEGKPLPDGFFKRGFGMRNAPFIPDVLGWAKEPAEVARLAARKEKLYRELVAARGIEPLAGVREWLSRLARAGVPCVVASSTCRLNSTFVLDIIGLHEHFRAIVADEDVTLGKPDPEVFLLAAERIRVPPTRCVVFEDTHVGIKAARAAGMRVVGVSTTHPAETMVGADRVVERLDELTVAEIAAWF